MRKATATKLPGMTRPRRAKEKADTHVGVREGPISKKEVKPQSPKTPQNKNTGRDPAPGRKPAIKTGRKGKGNPENQHNQPTLQDTIQRCEVMSTTQPDKNTGAATTARHANIGAQTTLNDREQGNERTSHSDQKKRSMTERPCATAGHNSTTGTTHADPMNDTTPQEGKTPEDTEMDLDIQEDTGNDDPTGKPGKRADDDSGSPNSNMEEQGDTQPPTAEQMQLHPARGQIIASGNQDSTVELWDLQTGLPRGILASHTGSVRSVAFNPDGKRLATGSEDGTVRTWNLTTGLQLLTLETHSGPATAVAFSTDGTKLAAGSNGTITIWEPTTGLHTGTLLNHTNAIQSVSFSPDSTQLASGGPDEIVRVWDLGSEVPVWNLEGHTGTITSVSFSPDGTRLASGSEDTTVKVWNLTTGEQHHSLDCHEGVVTSVSFSADGKKLASGSRDSTVWVWDPQEGILLDVLEGHTSPVLSVSFSQDGTRLASGSTDTTVKVWDLTKGSQLHTLHGHGGVVNTVAISPDRAQVQEHIDTDHSTPEALRDEYNEMMTREGNQPNEGTEETEATRLNLEGEQLGTITGNATPPGGQGEGGKGEGEGDKETNTATPQTTMAQGGPPTGDQTSSMTSNDVDNKMTESSGEPNAEEAGTDLGNGEATSQPGPKGNIALPVQTNPQSPPTTHREVTHTHSKTARNSEAREALRAQNQQARELKMMLTAAREKTGTDRETIVIGDDDYPPLPGNTGRWDSEGAGGQRAEASMLRRQAKQRATGTQQKTRPTIPDICDMINGPGRDITLTATWDARKWHSSIVKAGVHKFATQVWHMVTAIKAGTIGKQYTHNPTADMATAGYHEVEMRHLPYKYLNRHEEHNLTMTLKTLAKTNKHMPAEFNLRIGRRHIAPQDKLRVPVQDQPDDMVTAFIGAEWQPGQLAGLWQQPPVIEGTRTQIVLPFTDTALVSEIRDAPIEGDARKDNTSPQAGALSCMVTVLIYALGDTKDRGCITRVLLEQLQEMSGKDPVQVTPTKMHPIKLDAPEKYATKESHQGTQWFIAHSDVTEAGLTRELSQTGGYEFWIGAEGWDAAEFTVPIRIVRANPDDIIIGFPNEAVRGERWLRNRNAKAAGQAPRNLRPNDKERQNAPALLLRIHLDETHQEQNVNPTTAIATILNRAGHKISNTDQIATKVHHILTGLQSTTPGVSLGTAAAMWEVMYLGHPGTTPRSAVDLEIYFTDIGGKIMFQERAKQGLQVLAHTTAEVKEARAPGQRSRIAQAYCTPLPLPTQPHNPGAGEHPPPPYNLSRVMPRPREDRRGQAEHTPLRGPRGGQFHIPEAPQDPRKRQYTPTDRDVPLRGGGQGLQERTGRKDTASPAASSASRGSSVNTEAAQLPLYSPSPRTYGATDKRHKPSDAERTFATNLATALAHTPRSLPEPNAGDHDDNQSKEKRQRFSYGRGLLAMEGTQPPHLTAAAPPNTHPLVYQPQPVDRGFTAYAGEVVNLESPGFTLPTGREPAIYQGPVALQPGALPDHSFPHVPVPFDTDPMLQPDFHPDSNKSEAVSMLRTHLLNLADMLQGRPMVAVPAKRGRPSANQGWEELVTVTEIPAHCYFTTAMEMPPPTTAVDLRRWIPTQLHHMDVVVAAIARLVHERFMLQHMEGGNILLTTGSPGGPTDPDPWPKEAIIQPGSRGLYLSNLGQGTPLINESGLKLGFPNLIDREQPPPDPPLTDEELNLIRLCKIRLEDLWVRSPTGVFFPAQSYWKQKLENILEAAIQPSDEECDVRKWIPKKYLTPRILFQAALEELGDGFCSQRKVSMGLRLTHIAEG